MQNKRLISYRRARRAQEGKESFNPLAFSPRPFQPDENLVRKIEQEQKGAFIRDLRQRSDAQAAALAQTQPLAGLSIARCTTTPYVLLIPSNAVFPPQLLVPQNPNRIFLQIFTNPGAAATGNFFYSFGSPAFFNNIGPKAMVTLALSANDLFNSSVIPSDEFWVASGANNANSAIVVFEGVGASTGLGNSSL